MTSLLITDTFLPRLGGRENYYHFLFSHLTQEKVVIVTPDLTGDWENFDRSYPLPIHRIPKMSRLWFRLGRIGRWQWFQELWKLIQRYHIDLVHCGLVLPDGLTGWLLWKTLGIPYIIYTHGKELLEHQDNPIPFELMKMVLSQATKVVANSHYTTTLSADLGIPAQQRTIIHPGIDPREWMDPVPSQHLDRIRQTNHWETSPIILSVGRLIERKGQDTVIAAMPQILTNHPHAKYLIIGDGPHREHLQKLAAEMGLDPVVKLMGEVPLADLRLYYALATVFVMVSRQPPGSHEVEGFGIVYLEANACGLAVVAGKSGGIADAVVDGETGYLVDPFSPAQVAAAIDQLLTDPTLRQQLADQGKYRAITEFNWSRSSDQLQGIIQSIRGNMVAHSLWMKQIRSIPFFLQRFAFSKSLKL